MVVKKRILVTLAALCLAVGVAPGLLLGQTRSKVAYPKDYRTWTHVKSMVIQKGHENFDAFGGFHHVYANDVAIAALKAGRPFPKGAILVFDLRKAITEDNAVTEGSRLVVGVMQKDPDRFAGDAGWGFEDFKINGDKHERAVTDAQKQCLSCHVTQKESDYVYSSYRE